MTRQVASTLFALAVTSVLFTATAPPAAAAPHYRAEPAAAPVAQRLVVRDLLWYCALGACSAGSNHSRPAIICAALAREVGPLRSFSAGGRLFSADELEKCNAEAR